MTDALATIVSGTGDPAFAVDSCGEILAWNDGATHVLGYTAGEATGEKCFELLAGRDVFGNRFCCRSCPIRDMTIQNEPVSHFEVSFRTAAGVMRHAGVTVLVLPDTASAGMRVVHILYPVAATSAGTPRDGTAFENDGLAKLTPREFEVLKLIATGRNTAEVAAELFIGTATVRHHCQSILRKLGVHSRLQAAAVFHEASSR